MTVWACYKKSGNEKTARAYQKVKTVMRTPCKSEKPFCAIIEELVNLEIAQNDPRTGYRTC